VVVARDVDHLEQRMAIRAALAFEQLALMGERLAYGSSAQGSLEGDNTVTHCVTAAWHRELS
jgi:hypothetical protein